MTLRFFILNRKNLLFFLFYFGFALSGQTQNGIFLTKTNLGPYGKINSSQEVYGMVSNSTEHLVYEMTFHWQEEDGQINSDYRSGLSISGWSNYLFRHNDTWTPSSIGNTSINVWVTDINGGSIQNSDTITINIEVLENTAQRLFLYESFSSTSCGTCSQVNPAIRELAQKHLGQAFFIGYQVNCWSGNPMCLFASEYISERVDLYSVQYTPYSVMGHWYSGNSHTFDRVLIDAELQRPAPIQIAGTFSIEGTTLTAQVTIAPFTAINIENLIVKVPIIQDIVSFSSPPGSNGETVFYHILRRFATLNNEALAPLQNGEEVSLFIMEDFADLDIDLTLFRVGAFVQDTTTFEIIQASELQGVATKVETIDSKRVTISPNPSSKEISVSFCTQSKGIHQLVMLNSGGSIVLTKNFELNENDDNTLSVNIESLPSGLYILSLKFPNGEVAKQKLLKH